MSDKDTFQRQHAALLKMGTEIVLAMQAPVSEDSVRRVRMLTARFKGALLVHQRMENEALYPRLLDHPDPTISRTAQALYIDLGDLYDGFLDFERRFAAPEVGELAPQDYYKAIGRLLKRLMLRMQREDNELYALVARADRGSTPSLEPEPDPESLSATEERKRWAARLASLRPGA